MCTMNKKGKCSARLSVLIAFTYGNNKKECSKKRSQETICAEEKSCQKSSGKQGFTK